MLHLTAVRHLGAHRLWVQFHDGAQGVVDLAEALRELLSVATNP